jgi:hypothetical protein
MPKMTSVLLGALMALCFSSSVRAQECDPDDIVVHAECPWGASEDDTYVHMHECSGTRECFKFYRSPCPGSPNWTLIYEGPNNEICDDGYSYGSCYRYQGEGFTDINGSQCAGSQYGVGGRYAREDVAAA